MKGIYFDVDQFVLDLNDDHQLRSAFLITNGMYDKLFAAHKITRARFNE